MEEGLSGLGFKIAEITTKIVKPIGPEREFHPWETWMKEHLRDRDERRVSRMVIGNVPQDLDNEALEKALHEVVAEVDTQVLKGNERVPVTNNPPVFVGDVNSPGELQDKFSKMGAENWIAIGLVADENSQKRLAAFGDHLAADGNIHMGIIAKLAQKVGIEPGKPNEVLTYKDGDKQVVGKVLPKEAGTDYIAVLQKVCRAMFDTGKYTDGIWVSIPVQSEIGGVSRLIPAVVKIKLGEGIDYIRQKVKSEIGKTKNSPEKSLTASWMALTSEGPRPKREFYKSMQELPLLGKPVTKRLQGDLLFSVMEAGDFPVASTTITPRPDSLVCTVVRDDKKNIKSLTLSGNQQSWNKDKLRMMVDSIN